DPACWSAGGCSAAGWPVGRESVPSGSPAEVAAADLAAAGFSCFSAATPPEGRASAVAAEGRAALPRSEPVPRAEGGGVVAAGLPPCAVPLLPWPWSLVPASRPDEPAGVAPADAVRPFEPPADDVALGVPAEVEELPGFFVAGGTCSRRCVI